MISHPHSHSLRQYHLEYCTIIYFNMLRHRFFYRHQILKTFAMFCVCVNLLSPMHYDWPESISPRRSSRFISWNLTSQNHPLQFEAKGLSLHPLRSCSRTIGEVHILGVTIHATAQSQQANLQHIQLNNFNKDDQRRWWVVNKFNH